MEPQDPMADLHCAQCGKPVDVDEEGPGQTEYEHLGDRLEARYNADEGWLLPFFKSAGRSELVPLETWLKLRKRGAELLAEPIRTGLLDKLECGCFGRCIGHPGKEGDHGVSLAEQQLKEGGKIHTIADIEEVIDNWQHRSDMMKCRTCMWYVPKRSGAKREIGRCRHSSPTIKGWPAIYPDDWCGAHKLDEEKL